jgi:hypothetical protein
MGIQAGVSLSFWEKGKSLRLVRQPGAYGFFIFPPVVYDEGGGCYREQSRLPSLSRSPADKHLPLRARGSLKIHRDPFGERHDNDN